VGEGNNKSRTEESLVNPRGRNIGSEEGEIVSKFDGLNIRGCEVL